jgi:hypothetical protein
MAVQTQIQTRRGTAASWTSTNPTLAAGEIGFESDTGKIKIGTGSTAWNALTYTASSTAVTYLFNATAAQTTFSGTDANGLTLAYTVGAEQVYLNGVLQVRGSDYTATNGTSIVLASGALVSDVLNVIAYSAMTITDTYTQAQADAKFFQTANAFLAGKNKIINGDFNIWQRGTTSSSNGYLADRWNLTYSVAPTTFAQSRQTFTPGTAPVAGYEGKYFWRYAITTVGSSADYYVGQLIEDVNTFAGQTMTFSIWLKADSARSVSLSYNQVFGSGGSGSVSATMATFSVTTAWTRFTATVAIPSIAGKTIGTSSYLQFFLAGTPASGFSLDCWGVQAEAGSIATPFQTATGTIQGELAACQRYYTAFRSNGDYVAIGLGTAESTTKASIVVSLPSTMRVAPFVNSDFSSIFLQQYSGASLIAVTALTISNSQNNFGLATCTVASGLTTGSAYRIMTNNATTSYIGFGAEL